MAPVAASTAVCGARGDVSLSNTHRAGRAPIQPAFPLLPEALGSFRRVAKRGAPAQGRSSVVAVSEDGHPSISITLSPAQVDDVLRAAARSRAPSVSALLGTSVAAARSSRNGHRESSEQDNGGAPSGMLPIDSSDPRLSRSLLRGLSLLTCFDAEGEPRGIVDLANALEHEPEYRPPLRAHARSPWVARALATDPQVQPAEASP